MEVVDSSRACFSNEYWGISARFLTHLVSLLYRRQIEAGKSVPRFEVSKCLDEGIEVDSLSMC